MARKRGFEEGFQRSFERSAAQTSGQVLADLLSQPEPEAREAGRQLQRLRIKKLTSDLDAAEKAEARAAKKAPLERERIKTDIAKKKKETELLGKGDAKRFAITPDFRKKVPALQDFDMLDGLQITSNLATSLSSQTDPVNQLRVFMSAINNEQIQFEKPETSKKLLQRVSGILEEILDPQGRGGPVPRNPLSPPEPAPNIAGATITGATSAPSTRAPVSPPAATGGAPAPVASQPTFTSANDVRAAFKAGTITREQAKAELARFGLR